MRIDEIRIERDRAVVAAERLLVLLLLVERDAEIAQCAGVIGIDRKRAARLLGGPIGPAGEAIHLAEIGAVERDPAVDLGCARDVLDRLARASPTGGR